MRLPFGYQCMHCVCLCVLSIHEHQSAEIYSNRLRKRLFVYVSYKLPRTVNVLAQTEAKHELVEYFEEEIIIENRWVHWKSVLGVGCSILHGF